MVDDKLDDQVWVTVVATGYGAQSARPQRRVEEPTGEPRVQRRNQATRKTGLGVNEIDVPEFIPRS
jgi:cell division protein FtsZ